MSERYSFVVCFNVFKALDHHLIDRPWHGTVFGVVILQCSTTRAF
jgi:hypothetical protein